MNNFITYFVLSNLCLLVFYILYRVTFSGTTLFKESRFFLNGTVLLALFIPFFSGVFKSPTLNQELKTIYSLDEVLVNGTQLAMAPLESINLNWFVVWLYIIGACIMLAKLVVSFIKIFSYLRKFKILNKKGLKVVLTKGEMPIFTFMGYLFWNTSISVTQTEKNNIIRHELTHLRERHGLDILLFEFLKIVMWFNPLVYTLRNEIGVVHEFLADKGAIRNQKVSIYGRLLFNQLFERTKLSNVNYFNQSQIKNRIIMITKSKTPNPLNWRSWTLVLFMIATFSIVACSEAIDSSPESIQANIEQPYRPDSIYQVAEQMPEFEGGFDALVKFIGKELVYPQEAKKGSIEGKVFIQFVVDQNGSVSNVEILKGVEASIDNEAVRVVQALPKYAKPGFQNGKPVKVQFVLPIDFRLGPDQ
ncbi:MAG: TonB family protein [Sphingobacteriales bacterium]|jgi:TonB family protein